MYMNEWYQKTLLRYTIWKVFWKYGFPVVLAFVAHENAIPVTPGGASCGTQFGSLTPTEGGTYRGF